MKKDRIKPLVLLTVFIDIIGLGIVIPVLPFYVQSFSGSAFIVTALFAVYAMCSFFSAPLIGALSDKFGRRPALLVSIASTAIGWIVFALANSVFVLFVARIIDGLAAGNMPVAQSALVDIAKDDKERTANLGLIGAIFGIGFIVGPFIGGALGHISHVLPFYFVGTLAFINLIATYFFFPETHTIHIESYQKKLSMNPFTPIMRAIRNEALRPNYLALFLFGLAVSGSHAIFSLYLNDVFGLKEFSIGIIFALMGIIIALNQAIIMKKFWLRKFSEPTLELVMLVIFIFGFLFLIIHSYFFLIFGILAMTFGQSVLRVVMNGQLIAKSSSTVRGEVLGISSSIISLSASIAPFVTGALFHWKNFAPFIFCAMILFVAFVVLFAIRRRLSVYVSPDTPIISEV